MFCFLTVVEKNAENSH